MLRSGIYPCRTTLYSSTSCHFFGTRRYHNGGTGRNRHCITLAHSPRSQ
jgi:hypothetical protein